MSFQQTPWKSLEGRTIWAMTIVDLGLGSWVPSGFSATLWGCGFLSPFPGSPITFYFKQRSKSVFLDFKFCLSGIHFLASVLSFISKLPQCFSFHWPLKNNYLNTTFPEGLWLYSGLLFSQGCAECVLLERDHTHFWMHFYLGLSLRVFFSKSTQQCQFENT